MREQLRFCKTLFLTGLAPFLWFSPVCATPEVEPSATPIICVHVNSTFVQAFYGKSRKEIRALIGWPYYEEKDSYMYTAKAPGFFGEIEGYLIIWFAGDKARSFQIDTKVPLESHFVRIALQNSPTAHFEPDYQPGNLTGENWRDKQLGYFAGTVQCAEHQFLLTIDLTPANERRISPLYLKKRETDK